jgi:hypothetical protein
MKLSRLKVLTYFFLAGVLTLPAWAAKTAQPGSLNYIEGQARIDNRPVDAQSVGSIALQPGQTLTTDRGKAEMLLTPGVFLRLDDASSVRMLSASLIDTELALNHGRAMVEVTDLHSQNDLRVKENGRTVQLLKTGLYDFDAAQNQVRVFHGKAVVFDEDRKVKIDGGHRVDFSTAVQGKLKAEEFDRHQYEHSDLYRWSSLRSSYLAEANVDAARSYMITGYYGPGWFGPGWYWDPWFGAYTFIPGDGIFYSPFGWGFFSPPFVFGAPVVFVRPPVVHHFGPAFRPPVVSTRPGVVAPAPARSLRGLPPRPVMVPHPGPGLASRGPVVAHRSDR